MEEVRPDGTYPMLFTELSCVCMPSFRPVASFSFLPKVQFLAFLKFIYIYIYIYRKGCGHIDILGLYPGDTNSKYIWICGLTSAIIVNQGYEDRDYSETIPTL